MDNQPTNAMSVDVEDYFQVYAFESIIDRSRWEQFPLRVERNCERIFALFDRHGIKATFFVLGWIAERCPGLIRRITEEGHELASHGYFHHRVHTLTPEEFRRDVRRTKALLEDAAGVEVQGYRAPSYSIGELNFWALDVLQEEGYRYSSSIYPIKHDIYGMPEAPRFHFYPTDKGRLLEIPVTTFHLLGRNFPCGGGGYFRLLPYALMRWALRRVNRLDGQSGVFYFHPWEIDPDQPRQAPITMRTRVRHYVNLSRMEAKLNRLLSDFKWDRMDRLFLQQSIRDRAPVWSPPNHHHLQHAD